MFGQAGPHESSDTGDVLIRSTRTPHPVPLRMSDQRLRSSVTDELRRKPDMASPPRAAGPSQPGEVIDPLVEVIYPLVEIIDPLVEVIYPIGEIIDPLVEVNDPLGQIIDSGKFGKLLTVR